MRRQGSAVDPKLLAILRELDDAHRTGTGTDAVAEADLELLSRHLPRFTVAEPTLDDSRKLVDRLRPILRERGRLRVDGEATADARMAPRIAAAPPEARFADRLRAAADDRRPSFGAVIRSAAAHSRSMPRMFWVLSALAVLLGVLMQTGIVPAVSPAAVGGFEPRTNVLIVLVPLAAGLGLSWSLRSYGTPMFELELSFPMTPAQWLLGRLAVTALYQAGLALAASFVLTRGWLDESLPVLVISWLAPLGLYCAGTLALTLRFGTLYGTLIMAALWLAQLPLQEHLGPLYFVGDARHPHWAESKLAALIAALLCAADAVRQFRRLSAGRSVLPRGTER